MYFSLHADVFSTSAFPGASKGEYWRHTVSDLYTPLAPRFQDESEFEGTVHYEMWGDVSVSQVSAFPQIVTHGPQELRQTFTDNVFFIVHLAGDAAVELDHRSPDLRLRGGDLVTITTSQRYRLKFNSRFRQLVIAAPVESLDDKWNQIDLATVGRLSDLGCDLSRYLEAVTHADPFNPAEAEFRKTHLLDLLWILISGHGRVSERVPHARGARHAAIERYIAAEFRNPGLNPETAAEALGISLRTLYKSFQETPTTFKELLLEHRLQAAQYLLSTEGLRGRAVSDIAFEVGFSDLSHFNRRFKQRFHQTPRDFIRSRRES